MNSITRTIITAAAIAAAFPAFAGPFTVSSPGAATQMKIKIAAELKDSATKDTITLPKLELTAPVAPHLNVAVSGQLRTVEKLGAPGQTGFGDVEVKAKWNFLPAGKNGVALAIEPALSLPTGSKTQGLGDGHAAIALPLIIGYKRGDWELGGEVGYEHMFGDPHHDGYAGLLAMRRITPALRIGSEIIVESEDFDFHHLDTRMAVGFKWKLGKQSEIQGLAGRTLHTADHHAANRFKFAWEYKW